MPARVKAPRLPPRPTPRQNTATSLALLALAPEAWVPCLYVSHNYRLAGHCALSASLSASACVSDVDGAASLTVRLWLDGTVPWEVRQRVPQELQAFLGARGFTRHDASAEMRRLFGDGLLTGREDHVDEQFHKACVPGPDMQAELAEVHAFLSRFGPN